MERTGVLIALAYPEEFVRMVPRWYQFPLKWFGIVQNNMIAGGHSALALVEKSTGKITYADFGRYITPEGLGRARTPLTDPDCNFEIEARFNSEGKITNEEEIVQYIDAHPEKTHGAGRLYASFCYDVNFEKAKAFIEKVNLIGSMPYDPFRKEALNCSRFVYETFKEGIIDPQLRKLLIKGNTFCPSPLGIVFYGTRQHSIYSIFEGDFEYFSGSKLRTIAKHFFLNYENDMNQSKNVVDLQDTHHWLDGIGDKGWFRLKKEGEKYLFERRKPDGTKVFEEEFYNENPDFDINQPFTLIHDCNALWCTVIQGDSEFRLYHKDHYSRLTKMNA